MHFWLFYSLVMVFLMWPECRDLVCFVGLVQLLIFTFVCMQLHDPPPSACVLNAEIDVKYLILLVSILILHVWYFIQFCTQLSWFSGVLKCTLLNKNEYIYVKDLSFQRLLKKYICVVWRTIKVERHLMTMGKCGSQSETSWEPLI